MPKPPKPAKPGKANPKGWLLLSVGGEEAGLPPGKAVKFAVAMCPGALALTVDTVRAAYPEPLAVGATADGLPVTLRSQVPADDDED